MVSKYSGDTARRSVTMRRSASPPASTTAKLDSHCVGVPGSAQPVVAAPWTPGSARSVSIVRPTRATRAG